MKILALYLPQFHEIEENNLWWGDGYTEWSAVRRAKPLFKNHVQPKIPLNNNYYDLSEISAKTWRWQSELAMGNGLYGFCVYHYWFKGKMLLEKPLDILLNNPSIDTRYCINWANETWTRTWYDLEKEVLMEQEYGSMTDWYNHYVFLSKYFKDPRYIKINNMPVFHIYRIHDIQCIESMLKLWNKCAREDGFNGIYLVASRHAQSAEIIESPYVNAYYNFEPGFSLKHNITFSEASKYTLRILSKKFANTLFEKKQVERYIDLDLIYNRIKKECVVNKNMEIKIFNGVFPRWDNTPRRGYKGSVYLGEDPLKFETLLRFINMNTEADDFVYLNAWNEWGEGCYIEPDEEYGYQFLKAIQRVQSGNYDY
ncbi:glycoside hydrolase family 99-like domain-containing protein [Synergistaceae bacterium OttesenSCG-928-D05]|nr:glycoside hydrolase family 99-like domain-containing protein [Synergistaceae bacterium OttesenSCG-928-D05]